MNQIEEKRINLWSACSLTMMSEEDTKSDDYKWFADYCKAGFTGDLYFYQHDVMLLGTNSFGLVGVTKTEIVVAFRGTNSSADIISDLQFKQVPFKGNNGKFYGNGTVHEGFFNSLLYIYSGLLEKINELKRQYPSFPIYITGHSKGGALAILMAKMLSVDMKNVEINVCTFAAPRAGNVTFRAEYAGIDRNHHRYESGLDIVPHLPLTPNEFELMNRLNNGLEFAEKLFPLSYLIARFFLHDLANYAPTGKVCFVETKLYDGNDQDKLAPYTQYPPDIDSPSGETLNAICAIDRFIRGYKLTELPATLNNQLHNETYRYFNNVGEAEYLVVVNDTASDWLKNNEKSSQINLWHFPDTIKAHTCVRIAIEWQLCNVDRRKDSGEVTYKLDGKACSFRIEAKNSLLKVNMGTVKTENFPPDAVIELGWKTDKAVAFMLSENSAGKYMVAKANGANWMRENLRVIGNRTLDRICITGSHDAGMSKRTGGTMFTDDRNTLTQTVSVGKQLEYGARYFDIRPVIAGGHYATGHYGRIPIDLVMMWLGANGQSLEDIVNEINAFTACHNELIIINLSHSLNTDHGYNPFNQQEWDKALEILKKLNFLFSTHGNLKKTILNEFIEKQSAVFIVLEDNATLKDIYYRKGFYYKSDFDVVNEYSDKNTVYEMANIQFERMKQNRDKYFLLSWTLTQTAKQAIDSREESIIDMANRANDRLTHKLYPEISSDNFPKILYTDNITDSTSASLATLINWKNL